ncbi:MAG: acylneuraminate cytidylyltransferase family protein [Muribaculaceae bacterium]|nr:acylneuraminate cytidylyltransferase family protein [Muribaculaceae bacterium]
MKPLIIIPARGGSKGIPKKNIVPLNGRPLIDYTIKAALEIADVEQVILSTDSDEIAETARQCGLDVPYMRPAALATDTAGSREVILDVMDWADRQGREYDAVVLLQPTSPLRTAGDIAGAMALYDEADADMVVSVAEARSNPYYNCFETDDDGYLHVSKGDGLYTRRQDVPPAYEYNGAVYVIRPESIRKMAMGAFPRRVPYVMPAERSVDIDAPVDLLIASHLLGEFRTV